MDFAAIAGIEDRVARNGFSHAISADDYEWRASKDHYFKTGASGLRCILAALANSRLRDVDSVLDLPCGYGRVARYLRAAFPESRIDFCDIDRKGVDFCAQTFSGKGIYSELDVSTIDFGKKYDLIWVGSLFTHVDLARTSRWLEHLCNSLSDDGVVVASFHGAFSIETQKFAPMIGDAAFAEIRAGYERAGFGYARYEGADDYGISLSSAPKILEIAGAIRGCRILSYVERGWADNHDVLSIARTDRLNEWRLTDDHWGVLGASAPAG